MADADGRVTYLNRAAERMFGCRGDEVIGRPSRLLLPSPEDRVGPWESEGLRQDGERIPIEGSTSRIEGSSGVFYTHVLRDFPSPIFSTAADSRRSWSATWRRRGVTSLGHRTGDELLKSLAALLRERLRETDTLARLGGDEFAILLPQTDARQARAVAENLLDQISRYELLVRMAGDGGEIIPPGAFLGLAERFGLIHAIDRRVVRRAIHLIAEHRRAGRELCLEVNLSGKAFGDSELLLMIRRELAETAINPACLVLEITETAAIADIGQARKFVDALGALGCRFALDDFGVGFSSFYHLKHLPVTYLKIDGSFIRNLPCDPGDQRLVKAMVEVARGLGKQTIAEFVGDEETLRLLREYGVDYAQGYHIGRPRATSRI